MNSDRRLLMIVADTEQYFLQCTEAEHTALADFANCLNAEHAERLLNIELVHVLPIDGENMLRLFRRANTVSNTPIQTVERIKRILRAAEAL